MEAFDKLQIKVNYVNKPELLTLTNNISSFINRSLGNHLRNEGYPQPIIESVTLDLTYGLLRNRRWVNSRDYVNILSNEITDKYQLSREMICDYIFKLSTQLGDILVEKNDSERFLEYLFLEVASSACLHELADRIAIDHLALREVKNCIENTLKGKQPSEENSVQTSVSQLVIKYAQRMKVNPWALDIARLDFYLSLEEKHQENASTVFKTLLEIFKNSSMRTIEITHTIEKVSKGSMNESSANKILLALVKDQIVYRTEASRHEKNVKYALSTIGVELIANAYVNIQKVHFEQNPSLILGYEDKLQTLAISQLSKQALTELCRNLTKDIAPRKTAIRVLFDRMTYIGNQDQICKILKNWALYSPLFWVREQAISCLGKAKGHENLRQFLTSVAESDTSCSVQNKAFEILLKHGS